MRKKNGFIATSLIYSFFLVFGLLMAAILAKSVENRILVRAIQEDIRNEMNEQSGFVVDSLEDRTYTVNELVNFANETWRVVEDKGPNVLLILNRSLTQTEIVMGLNRESSNSEFYGTCNTTSCMVRACRNYYAGQEFCYLYSGNTNLYRRPAWRPTASQVEADTIGYGRTIVSTVLDYWFTYHQGLQRVLSKNKLQAFTFSDGFFNYPQSGQENIYVRTLLSSEITSGATFASSLYKPFHLLNAPSGNQINIYNTSNQVQAVASNTAAFIYPVIEVIKG